MTAASPTPPPEGYIRLDGAAYLPDENGSEDPTRWNAPSRAPLTVDFDLIRGPIGYAELTKQEDGSITADR